MTSEQFIALWQNNALTERGGAQAHFDDLCDLLGVDKPRDPDNYCFERGAKKASGGDGWADVWKRGYFAWENKKPGRDLKAALKQLTDYALNLDNPPLLIVCDRERIEIHTAFTGYPHVLHSIALQDLLDDVYRQILRYVFTDPEKLRPIKSTAAITEEAAGKFSDIAAAMRERALPAAAVAHFLIQCLFCMFSEDEGLLPRKLFTTLLEKNLANPERVSDRLTALFKAMQKGGDYGDDEIRWFNGGLFKTIAIPQLTSDDLFRLYQAALLDWRAIDPTIFGTLFERGLDPKKRSQLGAHYTDRASILRIINPVIVGPLRAEWQIARSQIVALLAKRDELNKEAQATPSTSKTLKDKFSRLRTNANKAEKEAQGYFAHYLEMLRNYRVLDPACGSGNFLYLALKALKDLEHAANIDAADLGLQRQVGIEVSPANVLGLELDPYAAELARVTVWIGEIQWMQSNGYPLNERPLLKPLEHIQNINALIASNGEATAWPACNAIIGNPPFLGDKMMRGELGDDYVERLRRCYDGQVPGGADLVMYWFEKARQQIAANQAQAAGLVSTNSIRQKRNRVILEQIIESTQIFDAWADEDWVNEGADVRVSLVCFGASAHIKLDGQAVGIIHADLSASDQDQQLDLTTAQALESNKKRSFFGLCLAGPFKVDSATALQWLAQSGNPNQKPNSDVVRPIYNGNDITKRWSGNWVVDFAGMDMADAADYMQPFDYVEREVKPIRVGNREAVRAEKWWIHGRRRPELRAALQNQTHYIATVETAKHRFFVRFPIEVAPEHSLIVFPYGDFASFGLLSSRIHAVWAVAKGGRMGLGNDPRYNSSMCFETFPFPAQYSFEASAAELTLRFSVIAEAAQTLETWREGWLNPSHWVEWISTPAEESAGLPKRVQAQTEHAAEWKKRTLTNLYNEMPTSFRLK